MGQAEKKKLKKEKRKKKTALDMQRRLSARLRKNCLCGHMVLTALCLDV